MKLHADLTQPAIASGNALLHRLTGAQLAKHIKEFTEVLNNLEIPSVSSMVEVFNHDLSAKALKSYRSRMEWVKVPCDDEDLEKKEKEATQEDKLKQKLDMIDQAAMNFYKL